MGSKVEAEMEERTSRKGRINVGGWKAAECEQDVITLMYQLTKPPWTCHPQNHQILPSPEALSLPFTHPRPGCPPRREANRCLVVNKILFSRNPAGYYIESSQTQKSKDSQILRFCINHTNLSLLTRSSHQN